MYNNWASDENVTKFLTWPHHKAKGMSVSYVNWVIKNYEKILKIQCMNGQ